MVKLSINFVFVVFTQNPVLRPDTYKETQMQLQKGFRPVVLILQSAAFTAHKL